jgi:DHA1 family bicyclomycin/chloramphenicol resistance-like MFS transporter
MRPLSHLALWGILVGSVVFLVVSSLSAGHPPLALLMTYLMVSFFGIGLLFGNLTTMAMQPLGAIAGTGSAVVGATSMLISLTLGTVIGQSYNGTVTPLVGGFAILSLCSLAAARFAERGAAPEAGAVLASGADLH